MVKRSNMYAVCRWNHRFSSSGRNRIFGLSHVIRLRQTASMMRNPSIARTSPAPRELHTLNLSVFNKASFWFETCVYLRLTTISHQSLPSIGEYTPMQCLPTDMPKQLPPHQLSSIPRLLMSRHFQLPEEYRKLALQAEYKRESENKGSTSDDNDD